MASRREFKDRIVQPPPVSAPQMEGLVRSTIDGDEFDGRIPEDCFYTDYSENDLRDLMDQQQTIIDMLKKHGKTKHMANRLLIIFDDLVGSKLFTSNRDNPFKKLNTSHRHFSCSMLMVTQAYKEVWTLH